MFANIVRDTRYAIRQLLRAPGFTVVAILTLALGIGATSAIFSVVNGVLLRPLAYPNPDRIVRVNELLQKFGRFSVAPATFLDWRQQNTVFSQIVAMNSTGRHWSPRRAPNGSPAASSPGIRSTCCRSRLRSAGHSARKKMRREKTTSSSSAMACGSGGSAATPPSSAKA